MNYVIGIYDDILINLFYTSLITENVSRIILNIVTPVYCITKGKLFKYNYYSEKQTNYNYRNYLSYVLRGISRISILSLEIGNMCENEKTTSRSPIIGREKKKNIY